MREARERGASCCCAVEGVDCCKARRSCWAGAGAGAGVEEKEGTFNAANCPSYKAAVVLGLPTTFTALEVVNVERDL